MFHHLKLFLLFIPALCIGQTWSQLPDFPNTERDDGVVITIGNKAYFGTGLLAGFTLGKDFYSFDLSTNTWSTIASMPNGLERQYGCAFAYGNSFYVFSGAGYSNAVFTDLQRYDVATNTWTAMAGKPGSGLIGASCLEFGDKTIIVGGKFQSGIVNNEVWEYNISTNTWLQKNNFPFGGRWRSSASVLNNVGYLLFGIDNNSSFRKEMYSYDHATDVWTKIMDFPQAQGRGYAALRTVSGQMILFGGYDSLNNYHNDTWYFNDVTMLWTQGPSMPSFGRKGGMSCATNTNFYYSCGINVIDTRLKETWAIDVPLGIKENKNAIDFSIYPNPCNDKLYINSSLTNKYKIELTDVNSKLLLSQEENINNIDISNFEKGIYFLKILDGNRIVSVKKIIKE